MTEATVTLTGRLDPRDGWQATNCAIGRTMEVVSNRTAFLVLREAFYGTTRFDDFAQRVGVSESVAAARLRSLVDAGMLERRPYQVPGERTRYDYHLTEAGTGFFPVLVALWQWGETWLGRSGVTMQHHECGTEIHAEVRCEHGDSVTVSDVDLVARRSRR